MARWHGRRRHGAGVVTATSARLSYGGDDSRDDNGPAREGVGPEEREGKREERGCGPVQYFFLPSLFFFSRSILREEEKKGKKIRARFIFYPK